MIIDMGTHMLSGHVGSQNLLQVAVPGLEDRCRTFGPLQGVLLVPGMLQLVQGKFELCLCAAF